MLIAIEGPSCAGKSTLAGLLRRAFPGAVIVGRVRGQVQPILSVYGDGAMHVDDDARGVLDWMEQGDEARSERLRGSYEALRLRASQTWQEELALQRDYAPVLAARARSLRHARAMGGVVLADRCLWSSYVHGYARFRGPLAAGAGAFAAHFLDLAREAEEEDLCVFLEIDHDTWRDRVSRRGVAPHPLLRDGDYFAGLLAGYRTVFDALGEERALWAGPAEDRGRLVARVLDWARSTARSRAPSRGAILSRLAAELRARGAGPAGPPGAAGPAPEGAR